MKFFATVNKGDSAKYHSDKNPYPFPESVENQPDIYWHNYKNQVGIRYQVWNKNTVKSCKISESAKQHFQNDTGKFKRVIISHGFGEHLLIYNRLCYQLVNQFKDIEVCVFEYIGSGMCLELDDLVQEYNLSNILEIEGVKYIEPLSKEKLFKAAHMKGDTNRKIQLEELSEFVSFFKQAKGKGQITSLTDVETILFGHSLGGQIATEYAFSYFPKNLSKMDNAIENFYIDSLALCGPLFLLAPATRPPSALLQISKMLSKVIPNVKIDSEIAVDELTNHPQVKNFMINDFPLLSPCIGSVLMLYQMISIGENMANEKYFESLTSEDEMFLPKKISLIHGSADGVNSYKGTEKVYEILKNRFDNEKLKVDLYILEKGKHSLFLCDDMIFGKFVEYLSK
ncbi:hypothetical protein QEN19_002749 [Hanseniaspora menglaensis]